MQQQRTGVRPEEQSVRRSGVAFSDIARTGGAEEELRSRAEQTATLPRLPLFCGGDEQAALLSSTDCCSHASRRARLVFATARSTATPSCRREKCTQLSDSDIFDNAIDATPNTSCANGVMLTYDDTDFMAAYSNSKLDKSFRSLVLFPFNVVQPRF